MDKQWIMVILGIVRGGHYSKKDASRIISTLYNPDISIYWKFPKDGILYQECLEK